MTEIFKNLPVIEATTTEWEKWLQENHTIAPGAWLKFAKKCSGVTTVTYIEARNLAIQHGWIDGLINKYDEKYYITRFTPRGSKSVWSKVNKAIAEDFIKNNVMTPAGLLTVEAAKKSGQWDNAYDAPSTMTTPADFQQALDKNPGAHDFFETITKANRYAFFYRLHHAKTAERRAALIEKFVEMLAAGEVFHS